MDEMPYRTADTRDLRAALAVADLADELADAVTRLDAAQGELLWPVLRGYLVAVDACAEANDVLAVEAAGERLVGLVGELAPLVARFRAGAAAADRDDLAYLLVTVRTAIARHFGEVESLALPLAEQYMTVAQWHEIGRHFLLGVSPRRREFRMGAMLLECERRDRSHVLRSCGGRRNRLAMARVRRSYLREFDRIQHVLGAEPVPVRLAAAS